MREAKERLVLETKNELAHQKKKRGGGKNVRKKPIFTNLEKRIRALGASSKATKQFPTK